MEERRDAVKRSFGEPLEWHRCEKLKKSYIAKDFRGGYRDDSEQWPTIQDRMIQTMVKLEEAVRPCVTQLRQVVAGYDSGQEGGDDSNGS